MAENSPQTAWILPMGSECIGAIGELHLKHLITSPQYLVLPGTPFYCREIVIWSERVLPVMDLALRLDDFKNQAAHKQEGNTNKNNAPQKTMLAVIAFQTPADVIPQFVAIKLVQAPQRIEVSPLQSEVLPKPQAQWESLSLACFEHSELGTIPILDLPKIFARPNSE